MLSICPPPPPPHFTQSQQNMHALPAHSGRLSAGWNGLVSQMFWEGKRVPVKNVNALSRVFADLFYRPQRNSHGMFFHPSALFLGPNPSRPRSPAYSYFSGRIPPVPAPQPTLISRAESLPSSLPSLPLFLGPNPSRPRSPAYPYFSGRIPPVLAPQPTLISRAFGCNTYVPPLTKCACGARSVYTVCVRMR